MRNLLRMDLRRMLRSKSFYVCLAIWAVSVLFTFALLYSVFNPEMQEKLEEIGVHISVSGPSQFETLEPINILEFVSQSGVRGGMFAVITGILATLFLCSEYESGFAKNVLALYENKWKYIFSKYLTLCLVNLIFLLTNFGITALANAAVGNFFIMNPLPGTALYLASVWMLENAFSALFLLACMITRSKAAGVAAGILVGSGTVIMLLSPVFGLLGWDKVLDYTIYNSLGRCPMEYSALSSLNPLLTGVGFMVVYTVIAKIVVQKKDV